VVRHDRHPPVSRKRAPAYFVCREYAFRCCAPATAR
jgi:hypothetical protein